MRIADGAVWAAPPWLTAALHLDMVGAEQAVLDEPSSALDAERERDQIAHIRAFAARTERSVLLISHRLSTVRWADQILVLEDSRVVERGSHEEPIAAGGAYAALFTMQASRYREE